MYKCWNCEETVVWIGDFMESEITGNVIDENYDRIVGYYRCPKCGSDYEYRQGSSEG